MSIRIGWLRKSRSPRSRGGGGRLMTCACSEEIATMSVDPEHMGSAQVCPIVLVPCLTLILCHPETLVLRDRAGRPPRRNARARD